jgi:hypothetical protein
MRKPVTGYLPPHSDGLQDPDCDRNYDHYVQNGLDAAGHGDKVVDEPQRDADYDQRDDDVYQRHFFTLLDCKVAIRCPIARWIA